ncbi:hypothetical protein [Companilactobacillus furfuricola]|uniref:hypothetical protein n=1 Tax=Companilactobacillus furfuricola TaxID=1462575 RepID=UPI000F7B8355|nr:hypothetical protein [Companilactobacillus furfuricola]
MKKTGLIVSALALLVLGGCSTTSNQTQTSKNNQSKASKVSSETKYYQNLNKEDKQDLSFKFKQDRDETTEDYADPVYVLSMTVKNKSDKTVKFDKSKFIFMHDKTYKINSSQSGTLVLKPNQTKTINQLFENIGEQALVGQDAKVVYLNSNNKLKDIKPNVLQSTPGSSDNDKAWDSKDTGKSDADLNQNASEATENTANSRIKSADMAKSLFVHAMGMSPDMKDQVSAVQNNKGYEITYSGISTLINFNGDEIDSDGTVTPYAKLAGPTHSSNGWTYNG